MRCIRTNVTCTWCTPNRLARDGRRERRSFARATRPKSDSEPGFLSAWSGSRIEIEKRRWMEISNSQIYTLSLIPTEESVLFLYCFNHLLPSLLQPESHTRYSNFAYWRMLASDHAPLRDIALACSALSMPCERLYDAYSMRSMRQKSLKYQISSSKKVRQRIESGLASGTEDWLLATVNCLTIFEVSQAMIKSTPTENNGLNFPVQGCQFLKYFGCCARKSYGATA